jgi:very-short-patch-repair endonuclease
MKITWQNPIYIAKALKPIMKRPTKPEQIILQMMPTNLYYIGNGQWWRRLPNGKNKNPDFKVRGQNKVIEVFGDYWHRNDNPGELINLYRQVGLDCLIIWEKEIKNNPEGIKQKIMNFIHPMKLAVSEIARGG